ncbi:MAG: 2-phospho-L-lactate guanylyltransferase [Chromatiales bacterium]|nr:MAG: 2-phospho-L-lactate guanylyltransferase [Chromatiales bacterium]
MTTRTPTTRVALVPVKAFALAKGRLAPVLNADERAGLAEAMLRDVIAAVTGAGAVDRLILLGGDDARRVADDLGLSWVDDNGDPELNRVLDRAADALATQRVQTLLVLPGDLPTLQSPDVAALLACHRNGLTISPARSDGGTNALVVSPPGAMAFGFGPGSARRHLAHALTAGLPAQNLALEAFARDIDRPADLHWLCGQASGENTARWLQTHDIEQRLGDSGQTALQA